LNLVTDRATQTRCRVCNRTDDLYIAGSRRESWPDRRNIRKNAVRGLTRLAGLRGSGIFVWAVICRSAAGKDGVRPRPRTFSRRSLITILSGGMTTYPGMPTSPGPSAVYEIVLEQDPPRPSWRSETAICSRTSYPCPPDVVTALRVGKLLPAEQDRHDPQEHSAASHSMTP